MKLRSLSEKLALSVVFLLGGVSVILSGLRYKMLYDSFVNPGSLDGIRKVEMFSALEFTCALIAFCLPTLRPYLMRAVLSSKKRWLGYQSSGLRSDGYSRGSQRTGTTSSKKRQRDILDTNASIGGFVDTVIEPGKADSAFGRGAIRRTDTVELTESFRSTSQERLNAPQSSTGW
jgi:hypothetical protein